jgi:HSP20 family protein
MIMTNQVCNSQESQQSCHNGHPSTDTVVFEPRVDIVETEQEFTLYADLPGVHPENLDVQFEDGELKIHGSCPPRNDGENRWLNEYKVGDYSRSFKLGETIDSQRINAELKNGVLTMHLPKAEKSKPRRVEITA